MTLALDTDVLVHWAIGGTPNHRAARKLLEVAIGEKGEKVGLTPQVLFEFLHVTTDPRRFQFPLSLDQGVSLVRELWDGKEVLRIVPGATVVHRTMELMKSLGLGRKRILDTALAATLEEAGVRRLATFNAQDYMVFPFLDTVRPD